MHKRLINVLVGFAMVAAALAPATAASASSSFLYKSSVALGPVGNLPSNGEEASATNELGNQITLDHAGKVGKVVVTMSSWACESGAWFTHDCQTTPGLTFTWPVTFSLYNAATGAVPTAGSPIAKITKSFAIPYRPSADNTNCAGTGKWFGGSPKQCLNGKAANITFDFAGLSLPKNVVFGISYNTTHYGYSPVGPLAPCYSTTQGCPYDSLNVGLTQDPTDVTAGSDPGPTGTLFVHSNLSSGYCDGGLAGLSTFREDSPTNGCWSVGASNTSPYYIPAISLQAKGGGGGDRVEGGDGGDGGDGSDSGGE